MSQIRFLGAAREVTGSCFHVVAGGARFLVDCGLFQGGRDVADRNVATLDALDPGALDFVLVTHAHLDHCGLLPALVARGYAGPIYTTPATADLLDIMLRDSAQIQEKEHAWRRKHPEVPDDDGIASPLYTVADVERTMGRVSGMPYDSVFSPRPGLRFSFRDAGHILGSAIVELWADEGGRERKIVFSGDLGQPARPIVRDPAQIHAADVLVVESTYGNRLHRGMAETRDELGAALNDALHVRRGNVIVPAFALGRTQELLAILVEEARAGRIGNLDVYVDSPLALAATRITLKHMRLLDDEARAALGGLRKGTLPLTIHFVESPAESKALNQVRSGAVIIAGSGMCDGGRIKHHLQYNLPRPECAVVFTGFQAAGTLGRRIVDHAEWVRIFGVKVPVRASIHTLGGLSAHADRDALLSWLGGFERAPEHTFVVHGESDTADGFAATVRSQLGWTAGAPTRGSSVDV